MGSIVILLGIGVIKRICVERVMFVVMEQVQLFRLGFSLLPGEVVILMILYVLLDTIVMGMV